MNYALIGCGRISINHIKAAFANGLHIVACCDLVLKQIDTLFNKVTFDTAQIKRYTDYKQMIKENRIDVVAIATESGVHSEIALFCIAHGINVIIEKPIAMSIGEADQIIALAKDKKVKVCVCHQNRFNEAVIETKKAIDQNRFGQISHSAVCVRWNRGEDYYHQASWRGTWKHDGGTLMNQCIHGIDLLLYLSQSHPTSVYGQIRQQFHPYLEGEDLGVGIVTFSNGSIGTIEGTVNVYPSNLEETLTIFGEKGTVRIGGTSTNEIVLWQFGDKNVNDETDSHIAEQTSNVYGNGHRLLYADMIDAIQKDREPLVSGIDGRNALEIVLSIYKSSLIGKSVVLPLKNFGTEKMEGFFAK